MKVQGTEPVVMAKVVDLTARQEVKDTRRTAIDMSLHSEPQGGAPAEALPRDLTSDEVVDRLNMAMRALSTRLKFQKHEGSGQFMVRVINEQTDEVIREIPAERLLDLLVHLRRMVGVLVDERA
ncbi:MAG: flagellar protein FlaG [Firmicutes bacterium]|nr:flagellar protein FlaG [Dethiobacter sp.]MBS3888633.1 flagellar protein FlaG [Bacillota bacterium]MBS4054452.1 flagellar protein FlaG [Thermaerobacter sp.]